MKIHDRRASARMCVALTALASVIAVAGCGGSKSSPGSPAAASGTAAANSSVATATSQCGTKSGVRATGTPINLGAIVTQQPGTDFTDAPNAAKAYFDCVNSNGGVNGHPIRYFIQTEQTQPAQIAAALNELAHSDHVVGMVGSMSVLECTVNHATWEKLGFYEIGAGVAPECNSTPNSATINMGPRYSSDGAVQFAIAQHVSKIVFDNPQLPNIGYIVAGVKAVAQAAHVPVTVEATNLPIQDANSIVLRDVNAAGPGGAIVLDHSPPQALQILQAAQKLRLEDRVKLWACSTPCDTDFLATTLGPQWNHKLFVNAELAPPDVTNTPSMQLYKAIVKQYGHAVSGGIGSFSQMGFAIGEITVHALKTIKGPYTVSSVNRALKATKGFDTGQLCRPWTYGSYPLHIPNNVDWTVTPSNGHMVTAQGCTPIPSSDPQIAEYRRLAGANP